MRNCRIEKFGKILNSQEFRNSEIDTKFLTCQLLKPPTDLEGLFLSSSYKQQTIQESENLLHF